VQYRSILQLYGHIIGIYRRSGERGGRKVGAGEDRNGWGEERGRNEV